jgi:bla regulator protein blaR1
MIEFVLKASTALLIFYTFYLAFLAKERMFGFNRFYLIFALSFSLLVPLLPIPLGFQIEKNFLSNNLTEHVPSFKVEGQSEITSQNPTLPIKESTTQTSPSVTPTINWIYLALGIYFLGLILFFFRFFLRIRKLIQTTKKHPTIQAEGYTYVLLPNQTLPYTFFHFLFVDKEAYENKAIEHEILHHELTHIRQKHSWDIILVELIKIIFWFNPLLILYKKAIQLNHEFLADEAVNTEFCDKTSYQLLLFKKVQRNRIPLSISSPFNASMIKRRMIMMGKSSSLFKTNLYKSFSLILTVIALCLLSSNKPFYSIQTYQGAQSDFEKLLAEGSIEGNPYQIDLAKLDLPALRKAYLAMDEEAKNKSSEFHFFDPMTYKEMEALQKAYPKIKTTIFFNSPPEKKRIPNDVYQEWISTKNIDLTINDVEKDKSELKNHLPSDFALFSVREKEEKKWFKKPTYQVSLYTYEYYTENHLKKRKQITSIRSVYPDSIEVSVFYHQKIIASENNKILDLNTEKFKASIFYQLRTLDTSLFKTGVYKPTYISGEERIGIAVFSQGKPTLFTALPMID